MMPSPERSATVRPLGPSAATRIGTSIGERALTGSGAALDRCAVDETSCAQQGTEIGDETVPPPPTEEQADRGPSGP